MIAAVSCISVLAPLAGCDNGSVVAERNLQASIDEARTAKPPPEGELPVVPASLNSAISQNGGAPPETRAEALSWLAQSEVQRAGALLDRAGREEIAAMRLVSESNRLAARLASNGVIIAGLQKLEPTKERTALQQQRGAVQGEQDPVWKKHETGPIPALKGVEQRISALQEQVAKLEQQSKNFADQRAKLLADAERLERQSEGAAGQQSVDLFNRGSEARKRAADLGVQVDSVEAQLVPLRQDLQLAQNEQKALTRAAQAFDNRLQTAEQTWKTIQQQIDGTLALSKALLGPGQNEPATPPANFAGIAGAAGEAGGSPPEAGDGDAPAPATAPSAARRPAPAGGGKPVLVTAPGSLVGKLRWLSAVSKSIEAQRAEAQTLLESALGHYKSAGDAANQLAANVSKYTSSAGPHPEKANWDRVTEIHNPSEYKLKQAAVQLMLAGLQRDRAASLAARAAMAKNVGPALQPNKLQPPQELAEHNVEADAAKAREAAGAAYKEADGLLEEVVQSKTNDTTTRAARAGHALRLASLYGQAQLAAQTNPQAAARLMTQAKQLATSADGDVPAAALPPFLQEVLDIRPPAPATAPARVGGAAVPAPGTTTPGATTPEPGATTPEPATPPAGTETPAAPQQPAPGTEGAAPAPEGQQPAPTEGQQPAPTEGQQSAPAEGQEPAPAEGQQPAPAAGQEGAQPAGSEQPAPQQPAPDQPAPDQPAPGQ